MKVTEEMRKKWEPLKESGDQTMLAKKFKKNPSTINRIINGKEEAKVSLIAKIDKFYEDKKIQIASLTETETD